MGGSIREHVSNLCVAPALLSLLPADALAVAADRWGAAMALYIVGFVSYGATLVFYAAIFPRLARNTPLARRLRERYEKGEISAEEYEREESLEKNRISNISTVRYSFLSGNVPATDEFARCTATLATSRPSA